MAQTQIVTPEAGIGTKQRALIWLRLRATGDAVRRDPRLLFAGVLGLLVVVAIFAPLIAPYNPLQYHPAIAAQGPSLAHPFGTDDSGRDQLSRVIYGTHISLTVGVASIAVGVFIGAVLGMIGGYVGGWLDQLIAVFTDAMLAFPSLILALALVAALGANIINLIVALAVVRVPVYIRLARGQTLQVRNQEYITASRAVGTRRWRILLRHVAPNIVAPLLVQATTSISLAIIDESVLSFLGLGVQPPTPEWGTMINTAQAYLIGGDPWMMFGPALAIVLTVLSFNIVGDALTDKLDPRNADR